MAPDIGNPHEYVATFPDELVNAFALAAHDEYGRGCVLDCVVVLGPAFIETVDPEAALLQVAERSCDVTDAHDGYVLECPGRGLRDSVSEPGGAAFGDQNGSRPGRVGSANDGSEIVRDLRHRQATRAVLPAPRRNRDPGTCRGSVSHNALVRLVSGRAIERGPLFKADRNCVLPAEIDDVLYSLAAGTFRHKHSFEGAPRFQRFSHGVDSNQQTHGFDGTASFCNQIALW